MSFKLIKFNCKIHWHTIVCMPIIIITFFISSFNSGTIHLQTFAGPVLGDYFLQRIIYISFAANGLKNTFIK